MKIEATIDRFEGGGAVLLLGDGGQVNWPGKHLPQGAKEGDVVSFTINENAAKTEDKKQLAKEILNEILDPGRDS